MKKLILLLLTLTILTNVSYASFPVTDGFNYVSSAPMDDGFKSLLWGVLSIFFGFLIFPSVLAIKYGVLGWNSRNSTASRIGLFLGVIGFLLAILFAVAVLGAMALGAAMGG
jgi:hypothetical protein